MLTNCSYREERSNVKRNAKEIVWFHLKKREKIGFLRVGWLKQKLFNNARKIPARRYVFQRVGLSPCKKGCRIKWEEKKKNGWARERASAEREEWAVRILFRIPTATKQVRSLTGTVNRQKIYWSSPRAYRWRLSRRNIFLLKHSSPPVSLFCQSRRRRYFSARVYPFGAACLFLSFSFLRFSPSFFFNFRQPRQSSSRPVSAEIVEIDRPFRRERRCAARRVPRVFPREIQLNTPPSHFRSHTNVTWIETWFFRPRYTGDWGKKKGWRWHLWSAMPFYTRAVYTLEWLFSRHVLKSLKILRSYFKATKRFVHNLLHCNCM